MELRHFRYFIAVVEQGSFTTAARGLHLSQPTLSQQIRDLERHVGVALLHRGPGGVTPTAAGLAFYERIVPVLAAVKEATAEARQVGGEGQTLRVGITAPLPHEIHLPVLSAFTTAFPRVRTVWRELTLNEFDRPLLDGEVDVALIRLPLDPERLVWEELVGDEPRGIAVPSGHQLWDATSLTLADVIEEAQPLVADMVSGSMRRWWQLFPERDGEAPRFVGEPADSVFGLVLSVKLNRVICPGPFALRGLLALSGVKVLELTDVSRPVTVAARRRDDRRELPALFCRLAAQVVQGVRGPGSV